MYFPHTIPEKFANLIADILTKHAGARLGADTVHDQFNRMSFVHALGESESLEWRFCGSLGFGGKFRNYGRKWYIDCYVESETPERLAMIKTVNAELATLFEQFLAEITTPTTPT